MKKHQFIVKFYIYLTSLYRKDKANITELQDIESNHSPILLSLTHNIIQKEGTACVTNTFKDGEFFWTLFKKVNEDSSDN